MSVNDLNSDTITFGKYKNGTLQQILKDRSYCAWLLKQDWFQTSYEYLHNRVQEYKPSSYFFKNVENESDDFTVQYKYFNLNSVDDIKLYLTDDEKICYVYYLRMIEELKEKINKRIGTENKYDIKAPVKWLKRFETETGLTRVVFKDFLASYELPNIPYIIERIKKEGGIDYKGARSFLIAKQRSEDQEKYWENILKEKYGELLGTQYKYKNCIFDFVHIDLNTIFECKLGLKDFNLDQYKKYRTALEKYSIIYIIGYDAVINMESRVIYTTDVDKYMIYQFGILSSKYTSKFDEEIRNYTIVDMADLSTVI